jgi:hypothetical protein
VGPCGTHNPAGLAQGGGRALWACGSQVHPPGVCLVPKILKYSGKKHIKFSRHSENFYFWAIFYCTGNSENRIIMAFYFILLKITESKRWVQKVVLTKFIDHMHLKKNPLIRLIKSY